MTGVVAQCQRIPDAEHVHAVASSRGCSLGNRGERADWRAVKAPEEHVLETDAGPDNRAAVVGRKPSVEPGAVSICGVVPVTAVRGQAHFR